MRRSNISAAPGNQSARRDRTLRPGAPAVARGKINEAIAELELAVASEPGNIAIRNDLALVLFEQGKIDASIAQFKAALIVDPRSPLTHVNLARVLAATRPHRRSGWPITARALELDPSNAMARDDLAKLLRGNAGPQTP